MCVIQVLCACVLIIQYKIDFHVVYNLSFFFKKRRKEGKNEIHNKQSIKDGPGQDGSGQDDESEDGSSKDGSSKDGSSKDGSSEIRSWTKSNRCEKEAMSSNQASDWIKRKSEVRKKKGCHTIYCKFYKY